MTLIILRGCRVLDGRGVRAERADVLVDEGRISAIEPGGVDPSADALAGAEAVDLTGLTVLPGLMNAHSHITLDASPDPFTSLAHETRTETSVRSARRLGEVVRAGVTTIRDLGGRDGIDIELRQMAERREIDGPRMLSAGRIICMTGGHGHPIGLEADGPDRVRAAVRSQIKAGATCIKFTATGGMLTPNQRAGAPQLTEAEMAAGVDEAHRADRTVAAHAEGDEGARAATLAGVDSIEHGHGIGAETVKLMIDRGTVLVPTILTDQVIVEGGTAAGIPDFVVEKCAALAPALIDTVELAMRHGLPMASGNDGGAPLVGVGDMAGELELLEEIGVQPRDALAMATTATARLFGLADIGLMEPGHAADLMAVRGDPLEGAATLRDPALVIARGEIVRALDG